MKKDNFQNILYELAGGCKYPVIDGSNKDTVVIAWEVYEKQWAENPMGKNFPGMVVSIKLLARFVGVKEAVELEDKMRNENRELLSYETTPVFAKVPKFVETT